MKIFTGTHWSYFDKYADVISEFLPSQGEGNTMTSQAVTAVNNLIYRWYNDGDIYDNRYIIDKGVNDLSCYANWLYMHPLVGSDPGAVKQILEEILDGYSTTIYENILKQLADEILGDPYVLSLNAEVPAEGSIYECDGPFFVEMEDPYDEWDDEWYDEWDDAEDYADYY